MPSTSSPGPALAELGELLTDIRKHSGKSQGAIAFRAGCGQPLVSRAERGERKPTPELFSVYLDLARKEPDMHRRLFLTAASAGIASALLPADALAQRLDASLNVDIDYWETRVAALGCDHMRLGADAMRPKLFNTLLELDGANGSGQLTHQIAKLTVLYARSQASTTEADQYYQLARHYATVSGDAGTRTWVNGRIALGVADNPATSHLAGTYAQHALAHEGATDTIGALGRYLAHYAQARAAAVLGDADPALAHLEQARYAYEAIDPDVDGSEWSYAEGRFLTDNSYVLEAIGRAAEAAHWADQARRAGVEGRFVTHLALHPLVGRHRAGDPDAAAEARDLMAAIETGQQSVTLRQVAAQAGAREFATAA
jgi:transcriptional regulator with XRE-family HTH domain